MTFSSIGEETNFSLSSSEQLCRQVSLTTIRSITHDFDDGVVIGFGGFGKVYKGRIDHGLGTIDVAIKRLDSMSNQGVAEFRAEIKMLSKLRHCNLVSLIGYCNDSIEKILVYDYMPRGTVEFHLFRSNKPLTWIQRLKISIGAARGLDYLHTGSGTQHGVIHRDVKSSNILLDENMDAKISDFGLSKIGPINQLASYVNTSVRGTFGYIDPDYFLTGRLTRKSDVYAFGVVMFELLSGRRAVDTNLDEEQCSLSRWAKLCIKERKLDQIVDPNIKGQISSKCLKEFAQIAYRCLHNRAKERPTMAEVVFSLQISQALQEKFDNSASPAGIMGITRKMQKYFISPHKENSGHGHGSMPMDEGGDSNKVRHGGDQTMSKGLKVFSYNELKHATNNFHSQMRRGRPSASAWVFKGWIDKKTYAPSMPGVGLAVSVKRLNHCYCGNLDKTMLDLKMLEEMDHPNLVKLIGYCFRGKELLLVHEFIENGSLEGHLLHGAAEKLPLVTRVKIAVGVARGLEFLYNTQELASKWLFEMHNILLDEDFNAKLSDFDVRKLVHGHTLEDHSLECYYHPWRNPYEPKDDNFDHGVVMLELLSVLQIRYDDQAISKQMIFDVTHRRDSPNFGSDIRLGLSRVLEKLEVYAHMTEKDHTCRN